MSGKPVLVTTAHRGVFFGYTEHGLTEDKRIELKKARNCVYWDASVRGFLGLAVTGPNDKCRIGPAVLRIELTDVTSVTDMGTDAELAWERAPWQR